MDRLISEQAVLKAVSKGCCELRGVYARCEEGIKAIPSAEPKTGHWIEEDMFDDVQSVTSCFGLKAAHRKIMNITSVRSVVRGWLSHRKGARNEQRMVFKLGM